MTLSPSLKRKDVPAGDAAIIMLADRLGRLRALDPIESIVLERAIRRQPKRDRRWTKDEDKLLLKMCGRRVQARMRAADLAEQLGRTPTSIYTRLCRLKKEARNA